MSLVTVRELAEHCGVDPRTVRNWRMKGAAVSVRNGPTGRGIRFTEAEAQRLSGKTWKKAEKSGKLRKI
jgi:DNA-binding transcriptional MerR regulator